MYARNAIFAKFMDSMAENLKYKKDLLKEKYGTCRALH